MSKIIVLSLFMGLSLSYAKVIPEVEKARKICREKNGILINQGSAVACFDAARAPINDYYSPAMGHAKPEKEDFDLLTGKRIRFYRFFREIGRLTVCNYTGKEIYTDFETSMDVFSIGPDAKARFEKMRMAPSDCKTSGSHMFALFADRKTAEMAVGLCATPDGRPYYDEAKYMKGYLQRLSSEGKPVESQNSQPAPGQR